jgi:hypothetical protein
MRAKEPAPLAHQAVLPDQATLLLGSARQRLRWQPSRIQRAGLDEVRMDLG